MLSGQLEGPRDTLLSSIYLVAGKCPCQSGSIPGTKLKEAVENLHFVTADNSEAKRLIQANRRREGAPGFLRRIVCYKDSLEHDSVHRIRIESSRDFYINSPLSRPALSAS
jgi:hypothetical protein